MRENSWRERRKLVETLLVQNDDWKLNKEDDGTYTIQSRDGKWTIGPLPGDMLRTLAGIVEHLDNLLKSQ